MTKRFYLSVIGVTLLVTPCQADESRWHSVQDYSDYVWKTPNGTRCPLGRITLEARLAHKRQVLSIGLDHAWLNKHGLYAAPHEEEATAIGLMDAGQIQDGETRSFEVAVGPHELSVGDDFFHSGPLNIEVLPAKTIKLVCGQHFHGLKKRWYGFYYLFHKEIPGKYYYVLRQSEDEHGR